MSRWQDRTAWFVNHSTGDDEAVGDSSHPIKSNAMLAWRLGYPGTWAIKAPTTITWQADHPTSDPLNLNIAMLKGGVLTGKGTPTVVRSSTISSSVTALNRSSGNGQCLTIQDGSFNWTSNVFNQIYIPSGTRGGARAFIAKDLGSGLARLCPFNISTFDFNFPTDVTPIVTDPYQIRTLTTLPIGTLRIDSAHSEFDAANVVNLVDLHLQGGGGIEGALLGTTAQDANVVGCWLDGLWIAMPGLFGECSRYTHCLIVQPGGCGFWGGLVTGSFAVTNGSSALFDGDMLCQGSGFVTLNLGSSVRAGCVGTFDTANPDTAISVEDRSALNCSHTFGINSLLYGTNNAGHGIKIRQGSLYRGAGTMPSINSGLGNGREVLLQTTEFLYSQLTNGAGGLPSGSSFTPG